MRESAVPIAGLVLGLSLWGCSGNSASNVDATGGSALVSDAGSADVVAADASALVSADAAHERVGAADATIGWLFTV